MDTQAPQPTCMQLIEDALKRLRNFVQDENTLRWIKCKESFSSFDSVIGPDFVVEFVDACLLPNRDVFFLLHHTLSKLDDEQPEDEITFNWTTLVAPFFMQSGLSAFVKMIDLEVAPIGEVVRLLRFICFFIQVVEQMRGIEVPTCDYPTDIEEQAELLERMIKNVGVHDIFKFYLTWRVNRSGEDHSKNHTDLP